MHPDQENFEKLRCLLVLKRYEQPPPGYFHRFSGEVIARIRAEQARERVGWSELWWRKVWDALETKPSFAGAFGVLMLGLLATGIVYSEKADGDSPEIVGLPNAGLAAVAQPSVEHPVNVVFGANAESSTGGMRLHQGPQFPGQAESLFQAIRPQVQRVNYFQPVSGQ